MSFPFLYPSQLHVRRHGPQGYSDVGGYRDWLRDEFSFRCVYCLLRERWVPGGFHLDHFLPQSIHPDQAEDYRNLIYSCSTCNAGKRNYLVPDPVQHLVATSVSVLSDGSLSPATPEARRIIEHLGLNRPRYREFRRLWMAVAVVAEPHSALRSHAFGFPADLPDLSELRPPGGNLLPQGIPQSFFMRRVRGELPEVY